MVSSPFRHLLNFLIAVFLTGLTLAAYADTLSVKTERQQIEQGDIISLWVEADFQTLGNNLDYSALDQDFQVLSRQRSNFYEFINGQQNAKTRWHLRLLPKKSGELLVPSLKLGKIHSEPLKLFVQKSQHSDSSAEKNFFLRAEIDHQTGYVQQQLLYKLRFYYRGKLLPGTGNIRPINFGNTLNEVLKDESIYNTIIDDNTYTVHEWLYALFPQQSGELTIAGTQVSGIARVEGRQKAIDEQANDITVQILPAADDGQPYSIQQPWLPAKSMLIQQNWQQTPQEIRVGDSLTRVITLQAFGLKASQLPTIETPDGATYKVYSQPPQGEEDKLDSGLVSRIKVTQNIVPTAPGEIQIPSYRLKWFNTETQHFEAVTLEGKEFTILPAENQPDYQQIPAQKNPSDTNQTDNNLTENQSNNRLVWPIWPLLTALFAIAWLITLLLWWLARKQKPAGLQTEIAHNDNRPDLSFQQWCQADDKTFYRHLRRHLHTQLHILRTSELLELDAEPLQQKIHLFEKQLYAADIEATDTEKLKAEICTLLGQIKPKTTGTQNLTRNTQLQALYPQTSRKR
ncbi:BatD family protein [Thiomicrorhabdus sp. 6S3-12]|uniref:BatD family protein n=1 Tax=Thiomicrorhabdus sp. 6S3-12 TaxID=2819681 RepID=UPI001AAC4D4F|nr:BatD family protein [Thiomicrorhabdus sp. 6S3-12]MBO1924830.1 BatD family protein [Thiomicrorhabdus sp. 6S3-12]